MAEVTASRNIQVVAQVEAQVRQLDAALVALLTGSAPISAAQWVRIREIEADAAD